MTETRRQTAFARLDRPPAWPATRGRPRPQRLEASLDALPGVGPTLKRKLASLGIATVRDLLEHVPRRYENAADEVAIAELHGDEEVVIVGDVLNVSKRPLRGRRTLVTARVSDGTATISATWFNQPWIADQLKPGMRVRLRGKTGRYGFDVRSYDLARRARRPTSRRCIPRRRRSRRRPFAASSRRRCRTSPTISIRCRRRCAPTSRCRSSATRSRSSTGRRARTRRRSGGSGSRSTSCCCSRSASHAAPPSASARSHRRSARRAT